MILQVIPFITQTNRGFLSLLSVFCFCNPSNVASGDIVAGSGDVAGGVPDFGTAAAEPMATNQPQMEMKMQDIF